jgi:Mrp family chromosome partitioning ATPase
MTHQAGHWKSDANSDEIPLLADLNRNGRVNENALLADLENQVEEWFRSYLSAPVAQPFAPAPPVPFEPATQRLSTRPGFDVVVRSVADLESPHSHEALVQQLSAPVAPLPQVPEAAPPPDSFTSAVVPKTAATTAPPLPHNVQEELLELRTEVMQAVHTEHLQTLMICGVEPGAGTSFVAKELTRLLAEYAQMRVAFLTLLPCRDEPVNRLARRGRPTPLQFLLRRTELPNLVEIASARGAITLTELLCHCSTAEVLGQMKAEFDLIVMDAPAIARHGEAALLAALADGVILVAEPHVTPLRRMDRAHRRLHKARAKVLGMVFNRQRRR